MESSPESSPIKYLAAPKPPKQIKKEPGESEPQGKHLLIISLIFLTSYTGSIISLPFRGMIHRVRYSWCRTKLSGLELTDKKIPFHFPCNKWINVHFFNWILLLHLFLLRILCWLPLLLNRYLHFFLYFILLNLDQVINWVIALLFLLRSFHFFSLWMLLVRPCDACDVNFWLKYIWLRITISGSLAYLLINFPLDISSFCFVFLFCWVLFCLENWTWSWVYCLTI